MLRWSITRHSRPCKPGGAGTGQRPFVGASPGPPAGAPSEDRPRVRRLRLAPNFWGALGAQIRGMGNGTRYGEWRTQRGRSAGDSM